jgi:hypothetical protein
MTLVLTILPSLAAPSSLRTPLSMNPTSLNLPTSLLASLASTLASLFLSKSALLTLNPRFSPSFPTPLLSLAVLEDLCFWKVAPLQYLLHCAMGIFSSLAPQPASLWCWCFLGRTRPISVWFSCVLSCGCVWVPLRWACGLLPRAVSTHSGGGRLVLLIRSSTLGRCCIYHSSVGSTHLQQ